jgi:hypothetical protein
MGSNKGRIHAQWLGTRLEYHRRLAKHTDRLGSYVTAHSDPDRRVKLFGVGLMQHSCAHAKLQTDRWGYYRSSDYHVRMIGYMITKSISTILTYTMRRHRSFHVKISTSIAFCIWMVLHRRSIYIYSLRLNPISVSGRRGLWANYAEPGS